MSSIFILGATLLVYSAERLISSLVGVSRGLRISVFLLAIIFTGTCCSSWSVDRVRRPQIVSFIVYGVALVED